MNLKLGNYITFENIMVHGFKIIFIVVLTVIAYIIGRGIINKVLTKFKTSPKRIQTLRGLLSNLLKYFIFFVALAMILSEVGINPISLVAGAGLVGVALGFGAQGLVKDVISGFFILFEGLFAAGDFVNLKCFNTDEFYGLVEEIGLRTTKLRDLSGETVVVLNGNILKVKSYPLGYIPYFITMVFPADIGRKSLKEWLDSISLDLEHVSKVVMNRPRIVQPQELYGARIMTRMKIDIMPSRQSEINDLVSFIKDSYKEMFYQELADPIVTELSEGVVSKYKSFLNPHDTST